jgi:hypothetical protein
MYSPVPKNAGNFLCTCSDVLCCGWLISYILELIKLTEVFFHQNKELVVSSFNNIWPSFLVSSVFLCNLLRFVDFLLSEALYSYKADEGTT